MYNVARWVVYSQPDAGIEEQVHVARWGGNGYSDTEKEHIHVVQWEGYNWSENLWRVASEEEGLV